ncbi:uncharacterized protein EV422DRAFT_16481 [Fimicolochytrium jonesii]|uniref:uncharacterized protein n=1 Tax=Fimicolochytrium jonesii TaxID=1396493 RepID=UPI0022FDB8BE|nr:uncharacterized protein EV422DRAFT_16481 [Fimicolochytrium jonesii]KAI8826890.1 hypothetical protein EV422DRAFT_16481 [Fimicolochytrium jonesii]
MLSTSLLERSFAPQPTLPPGNGGRIIGCTSSTTQQPTDHLATPPITSTPPTDTFDTTTIAAASTTRDATLAAYAEHDPAKRDAEKNQVFTHLEAIKQIDRHSKVSSIAPIFWEVESGQGSACANSQLPSDPYRNGGSVRAVFGVCSDVQNHTS